jgi:hypothetical protein
MSTEKSEKLKNLPRKILDWPFPPEKMPFAGKTTSPVWQFA